MKKDNEEELKERANRLVGTSVDDLRSSLGFYKYEFVNDVRIIEIGFDVCTRRGEKTKAKLLNSKLRKMRKEEARARYFRLLQQAYD